MKVSELAKELGITSKEVVEKAANMGIEAKAAQSNRSDIDATAIKNSILAKKKKGVNVNVYTFPKTKLSQTDISNFNAQYPNLTIQHTTKMHDRFMIIDRETLSMLIRVCPP